LPISSIEKGSEKSAQEWRDATGVDPHEIDPIALLQPDLLGNTATHMTNCSPMSHLMIG
jgi:hypothetical protein